MNQFSNDTLVVEGLGSVQRAFSKAGREISADLRDTLKEAAGPVKESAQALALTRISRMTVPWSEMRVGVTRQSVYMVPKQRGQKARKDRRLRRPRFGVLLMQKAMEPALAENAPLIQKRVEDMLVDFAYDWSKVG